MDLTTTNETLGPDAYRPGACNIGPAEIARRRNAGLVGAGATAVLTAALVAVDAPAVARWLVAIPATVAVVGFVQARLRFCAGFGLLGVRNFGPLGRAETVEDVAARAADRRRALLIGGGSMLAGLALAALLVWLPL